MLKKLLPRLHIRLLILILVSVMPAFGIIAYSGIEHRDQAVAAAEKQALAIMRGITMRQHELMRQSHELLGKLAGDPALRAAIRQQRCGRMLAERRELYSHYTDFFAADARGDIVCSASPEGDGVNINDRTYFRRAMESRDFAVGDYQVSRITGKSTINLAYPVLDEGGVIEAVIAVGVDLRWLSELIASAALPSGSILSLVDSAGTILARTPDAEGLVGRTIPERDRFLALIAGPGQGSIDSVWLDGVRRVTHVAPIYGANQGGIYMRVGIPHDAVFGEAQDALLRNVLLMLGAAILVLAFGWLASDHLVLRRVRDLRDTARRFGAGDFGARPHIAPDGGELGELASAFDEMAAGLAERQQRIDYLATRDSLTDLPNRRLFLDRATQALAYAARSERYLALLMINVDRLSVVNDSLGRAQGDALLAAIADRLRACVRQEDTVARFEGDEFTLLLADLERVEHAVSTAAKIAETFSEPLNIGGNELHITVSVGVALYPEDGESVHTLIKYAHSALHRVKAMGGNGLQFYAPQMSVDAAERLRLEQALRRALERDEFELHYQPKVCLRTGRIAGLEALIRWRHPEIGMVAPDRFIPLAEETGLIEPIGAWVLRRACLQIREWQDAGLAPGSVAVNLSARQFWHGGLAAQVSAILEECGVAGEALELEITETAVMRDLEATVVTLLELRDLGAAISIDDFGTGYSSLGYLRRLPLNKLKIDRSFVRDITHDPSAALLTREIVAIAHALNLTVVAEGVEHEAELAFLVQNGCDEVQGYYFSRPLPAADIRHLLEAGKCWPVDYA